MKKKIKRGLTPTQVIALGFLVIILIGTLLLSLPLSSRTKEFTPFVNALFTATSATCVTGLIAYDTYTHWSLFGQLVIITLIQIGGIGFMSVALSFAIIRKKKIGLKDRNLMQEAIAAPQLGGIVKLTKLVILGTFIIEFIGSIFFAFRFCPEMGIVEGIYNAVFHSISSFCNAGFDLMGKYGEYTSLTRYKGDILVNLVAMSLIIIGGIGFFVWKDIYHKKLKFRKYTLHTKIVLVTTICLIIIPTILVFLIEVNGGIFETFTLKESILASFFQVVSPRTAGYNTVDLSQLQDASIIIIIILMLIGGSSGSTAGGIKTTTFAVLLLSVIAVFRKRDSVRCFKRRIEGDVLKRASAILIMYLSLSMIAICAISIIDAAPLKAIAFDVFSAINTVGLTLGLTPELSYASKVILVFLMYFGRVGCLTLILVFADSHELVPSQFPLEKITVG